ncbi:hypothetical protein D3C75_839300 [compost metagenome]
MEIRLQHHVQHARLEGEVDEELQPRPLGVRVKLPAVLQMLERPADQADLNLGRMNVMADPGREALGQEGEAHARLSVQQTNAGSLVPFVPDAHGRDPRHEGRIGLHVRDQIRQLFGRIGKDARNTMNRHSGFSAPNGPPAPDARPSDGRSRLRRGATSASAATTTPSGSPWRGRWPHRP